MLLTGGICTVQCSACSLFRMSAAQLHLRSIDRGTRPRILSLLGDLMIVLDSTYYLQSMADDLKNAERNLTAAQSALDSCSAEADQVGQLQTKMTHCVTECSSLACALTSLEGQCGAQKALHSSIQSALFSGRKHAALAGFQQDLCTARRDVRNLDKALICAAQRVASSADAVSDVKQRSEDLLHQPKPR